QFRQRPRRLGGVRGAVGTVGFLEGRHGSHSCRILGGRKRGRAGGGATTGRPFAGRRRSGRGGLVGAAQGAAVVLHEFDRVGGVGGAQEAAAEQEAAVLGRFDAEGEVGPGLQAAVEAVGDVEAEGAGLVGGDLHRQFSVGVV